LSICVDRVGQCEEPYYCSRAHVIAQLTRIDSVLHDAVCAKATRPPGQKPVVSQLDPVAAPLSQQLAERIACSLARRAPLRFEVLAERFGLNRFDLDVVLLGLLAEIDARYEQSFAYLQGDANRVRPTVDLALSLFCDSLDSRLAGRERLRPHGPLVRHRLVVLVSDRPELQPPLASHYLKVDDRIVDYLLHDSDELDERLCRVASLVEPRVTIAELILPDALKTRLLSWAQRESTDRSEILYLRGRQGVGRKTVAEAVCKARGQKLLVVDLPRILTAPEDRRESLIKLALREARLAHAAILWKGFDALLSEERANERALFLEALERESRLMFVAGETQWAPSGTLRRLSWVSIEVPAPAANEQAALWNRALNRVALDEDVDIQTIISRHGLSGGRIHDVVATAHDEARFRDPLAPRVGTADLLRACKGHVWPNLGANARKVETQLGWDDVVLSRDRMERLYEVAAHARHRRLVFDAWGFGRKLSTGRGLSVLFSGPPGTGKTLAASVLANDLGVDLYQIDLSSVVSKYIGETEKQLERIFTEAESSRAVLFFDEADALFGKRTEVRDAHDRYANLETSYLLQRMDSYEGLVILASNLSRNMDEAFIRRLRFIVEFAMPSEAERLRIWQQMLPAGVPRGDALDLAHMARRFELSGANIRNIALAAAFLAAEAQRPIAQSHLLHATRREYQKMGRIMDETAFRWATR
jgi:SpoVK/Ycf46/Vps4 family AAA+-type ATPase